MKGTVSIVTGGSKGIGKAAAIDIARRGGSVCIIARDKKALEAAASEISGHIASVGQFVETISADTTKMAVLKPLLAKFIGSHGVPDYLFNCVGYAYPQYIDKLTLDDFKNNMETNYYGQLVPILILLPHFMKEKRGYIAACSSALGFMGMMGYATYVPSKYAVVGLMESLRHELKPLNIGCSIVFPPDTDTPGFEIENKTKPREVAIMSEGGGLLTPEKVAAIFVKGVLKKKFYITPGQSGLLWRLARHFPRMLQKIMDGEYKKAVNKKNAER